MASNNFWHIMRFQSGTSKILNTTYQTSLWVQISHLRVALVLNNRKPAEVKRADHRQPVPDLTAPEGEKRDRAGRGTSHEAELWEVLRAQVNTV